MESWLSYSVKSLSKKAWLTMRDDGQHAPSTDLIRGNIPGQDSKQDFMGKRKERQKSYTHQVARVRPPRRQCSPGSPRQEHRSRDHLPFSHEDESSHYCGWRRPVRVGMMVVHLTAVWTMLKVW